MRIYDPRIGKFLSVDPLTRKYPELTPYQFASNRPIDGVDEDGLEYSPASSNNENPRDASSVQIGINPADVLKRMMDKNKNNQPPVAPANVINPSNNATLSQAPAPGTWALYKVIQIVLDAQLQVMQL